MADAQRVKPRILSGFLELLPQEQLAFARMFETIRRVYELYGFTPIETPAIELSEVLFAKGGGETEKQIYEVVHRDQRESLTLTKTAPQALHFDLTVPLARYVAQYESELVFPFRRYQMQKVWRAERAQRGRFREFYQCDIDIIGSRDPTSDAEIPGVIYAVFQALGFDAFTIRLNNRKVLNGFFRSVGLGADSAAILREVDKIDKIGREGVLASLLNSGVERDVAEQVLAFVGIAGSNEEVLQTLQAMPQDDALFREGVSELARVHELMSASGVPDSHIRIDLSIARGLDYYTGTVYETVLDEFPEIGSVCSGGRYDDLAGNYTKSDLPGVGVSIGLTRLFYQLREAGLIELGGATPAAALVVSTGSGTTAEALQVGTALRDHGIPTQVFYDTETKLAKQMRYADRIGVPFVVLIGEDEIATGTVTVRDLGTGEQSRVSVTEAADLIRHRLGG